MNAVIKSELNRIASEHGDRLLAKDVVEAAKPKSSPLHSKFCWDDTEAARKYRLDQARDLIQVYVTLIPFEDGKPKAVRAWVSLTPDRVDGSGYRRTVTVLSTESLRAVLVADAIADMKLFRKKYSTIVGLAEVFEAMTKAEINLVKLQVRKSEAAAA